jgi:hypothetical protein
MMGGPQGARRKLPRFASKHQTALSYATFEKRRRNQLLWMFE